MDINALLALIIATTVLVSIPGPNVAFFVANTISYGLRYGAATVLGTTIGVALQLVIVVLGLTIMLEVISSALSWIKWIGVAYLIYLGIISWRQGLENTPADAVSERKMSRVFWQGLFLAAINPKTMLFSAAFLPQFVNHDVGSPLALAQSAIVYLTVIFVGDLCWIASAQFAKPAVMRLGRLRHKLTGCLFFTSGVSSIYTR